LPRFASVYSGTEENFTTEEKQMPFTLTNQKILVPSTGQVVGTGWLPPMYDPRDYTPNHEKIEPIRSKLCDKLHKHKPRALAPPPTAPSSVDLRPWCSPIENQGGLGSCTAHAAAGIVEYYQRRSAGKYLDGSRLFIYKTTRNLLGVTGDTGAWIRNTMAALVSCGVPPERYWPYTDQSPEFDREPPSFVYAVADNFEALKYFSHDPWSTVPDLDASLTSVKQYLAAGIPSMFGFFGYPSFDYGDKPGHIPFPTPAELLPPPLGNPAFGHAVVAVGYDNQKKITNTVSKATTNGAFLIRNSWGTTWGDVGYGWLPYEYLLKGVAMDFWSLISMEWVDMDQFYTADDLLPASPSGHH
jgi:C1A family cysteine protease